jgi:hypothetical protein
VAIRDSGVNEARPVDLMDEQLQRIHLVPAPSVLSSPSPPLDKLLSFCEGFVKARKCTFALQGRKGEELGQIFNVGAFQIQITEAAAAISQRFAQEQNLAEFFASVMAETTVD